MAAPDIGAGRCPSPYRFARRGDQGFAFIAIPNTAVRPAVPAVRGVGPSRARDRGLCFLHAARERRPLAELAGAALAALRFDRFAPSSAAPRTPATPDAGAPNELK
jgi:hypothetical protein